MNICTSTHQTPQAPRLITGELSLFCGAVAGEEATVDSCLSTPPNCKQFGEDPGRRNDGSVEIDLNYRGI